MSRQVLEGSAVATAGSEAHWTGFVTCQKNDFHKSKSMNTKTEIMNTLLAECLHCMCGIDIPADAAGSDI